MSASTPRASDGPAAASASADHAVRRRARRARRSDAAVALPFLGAFLLVSPLIELFVGAGSTSGAPLILLYLFGVWAALILAAAGLSRLEMREDAAGGGAEASGPDGAAGGGEGEGR